MAAGLIDRMVHHNHIANTRGETVSEWASTRTLVTAWRANRIDREGAL